MSEELQATFMQARIVRMARERWGLTAAQVVTLFRRYGVFEYVRDSFDYFHLEGDEAVLDQVCVYLEARGVSALDAAL